VVLPVEDPHMIGLEKQSSTTMLFAVERGYVETAVREDCSKRCETGWYFVEANFLGGLARAQASYG
jgi:hypothetical protein